MVWMVTPLPVVTMPTMRSPGKGWQQPAKCMAMPGIRPRIGTACSLPLSRLARRRDTPGELVAREVERHGIVLSGKRIAAGWRPATPGARVPPFTIRGNGFPS